MIKGIVKGFNVLKNGFKNEFKLMKSGTTSLINRYDNNYYKNFVTSKLQGKDVYTAAGNSCFTALKNMHIKRNEIPAAVGLLAGALPIPASSGVGYALARVATCDKAITAYHAGSQAVKNAYHTFGHIFNV